MTFQITQDQLDDIFEHALADSPDECCGILIGDQMTDIVTIHRTRRVANVWDGERTHRFELDARSHVRLQREAREAGLEIVGFYHSHPTGEAVPSAFDVERAWPGVSYLIVSLDGDRRGDARSWRLDDGESQFVEEEVLIL